MRNKIVFISDFNFRGSGYLNISIPLCDGLANLGYDVKAIGLGYTGTEHTLPFTIIPCNTFQEAQTMLVNLHHQWKPDLCIVALDIPRQDMYSMVCRELGIKMIAITPLENPPLTMSWAYILQQIDKVFFISQLGTDEAIKAGVEAEHLVVGMDTNAWRMRTIQEYHSGRSMMNISSDTLVILTVADNQERKNLSKAYEIVSKVKKSGIKVKYILVTRENLEVGYKLRDLGMYYKIASDVMIFERGISFKELYSLYAISDAFLLTSKGEGLCEPVLEAMSVGVPVVAPACGSMPELLADGRGFIMDTAYPLPGDDMIDPWGNEIRTFPSSESGKEHLTSIFYSGGLGGELTAPTKARIYMEERTWDKPIGQLVKAIKELTNE